MKWEYEHHCEKYLNLSYDDHQVVDLKLIDSYNVDTCGHYLQGNNDCPEDKGFWEGGNKEKGWQDESDAKKVAEVNDWKEFSFQVQAFNKSQEGEVGFLLFVGYLEDWDQYQSQEDHCNYANYNSANDKKDQCKFINRV